MDILVTGGAGFIGTNLIISLLQKGHNVTSLDNYSTGLTSNHQEGCTYINKDIVDIENYSEYGKFDIVYHLAAMARIQPSFISPEKYFLANAYSTLKIAQYCSQHNIPLIYAGSSSHHSGRFKNPYTFSKDVGEDTITLFQTHYGLKSSISRFYNVYGPYHLKEGNYSTLIGSWEKKIENNEHLIIYGDGSKRRDFTHVNDIVKALILILEKQAWGYIFELGRGKNYSVKEIAEMFGKETIYKENKPGEAQDTLCLDTLANSVLGWEPTYDIKEYIKQYLNESNL
jgi:UDP-glucose 4-epimerase